MLPQLKLENCPCAHVCRSLLLPHVGGFLIKSPQSFLTSLLRFLHYRLCVAHRLSQGLLRHGGGLLCKAAECRRVQQRLLGELGYLSAQHRSKYLWWTHSGSSKIHHQSRYGLMEFKLVSISQFQEVYFCHMTCRQFVFKLRWPLRIRELYQILEGAKESVSGMARCHGVVKSFNCRGNMAL